MESKTKLRAVFLAKRKKISKEARKQASRVITRKILALGEWKKARTVCIYRSTSTEVDTATLISRARKKQKTVIFPAPDSRADLFIIPGIVFDHNGWRLGWGKGYYDKLLSGVAVPKIGLAYQKQIVAHVPHTSYDVPMDTVVTEENIYAKTS